MIRFFDIFFSVIGFVVLLPVMIFVFILGWIKYGSPLFFQKRIGRYAQSFHIIKFRTMALGTPDVATHLVDTSAITEFGVFLRRSKLDELPQLWNVIIGDMSLVGPRPCLLSQNELINERMVRGVFSVRPGMTGLAQITKIDMSRPRLVAETDKYMIERLGLCFYFKVIMLTTIKIGFN